MPKGGPSHPIVAGHRVCSKCEVRQPIAGFNKSKASAHGIHPWCKACRARSRKALYDSDPKRYSEEQCWRSTKWKYGITREQYDAKHAAQDGQCAICGAERARLCIDHDHACCPSDKTCGACLRELLCFQCNTLLGLVHDNTDRLLSAVAYLRRWSPSQ